MVLDLAFLLEWGEDLLSYECIDDMYHQPVDEMVVQEFQRRILLLHGRQLLLQRPASKSYEFTSKRNQTTSKLHEFTTKSYILMYILNEFISSIE